MLRRGKISIRLHRRAHVATVPVNPNQILLSLKKNLHRRDIVSEAAQTAYQQNFGKIGIHSPDTSCNSSGR